MEDLQQQAEAQAQQALAAFREALVIFLQAKDWDRVAMLALAASQAVADTAQAVFPEGSEMESLSAANQALLASLDGPQTGAVRQAVGAFVNGDQTLDDVMAALGPSA